MTYEFVNVNLAKLQDELINAGVRFVKYLEADRLNENGVAQNAWCEFEKDVNMNLVEQIISAHDTSPLPQPLTELEQLRLDQAQANSELVQLIMMMGGV